MRLSCALSALCVLVVVCACASAVAGQSAAALPAGHVHYAEPAEAQSQASPTGALAPRLQNLGSHTFPVSTRNGQAQAFMNQGLNLAYAFNHAEARRAFREAARLDPDLAMAYWGQALVLGPNINAVMEPNEEPQAFELVQKAVSMKASRCRRASRRTSRRWRSGIRERPRIGSRAMPHTRTPCGGCTSGSRTTWMPRCSTSSR